jgi:enoyl-CoA hydratase
MSDVVLVDVADRVAVITLNRPEARNALNADLRRALPEAVLAAEADPAVDVIVLTGADPAFCAGLDLKELSGDATRTEQASGEAREAASGRGPWRGPLPPTEKLLIGAINGVAITGGFELALNCDFLIASERARFADTHARVGIMPGWGLTVRLVQLIGPARAKELSVTGNFLDAQTAYDWGLVNHVVPHDELLPSCRRLAADSITIDQDAVKRMIRTYDEVAATTSAEAWEIEGAVSDAWMRERFSSESLAARRQAIQDRGRGQVWAGQGSPGRGDARQDSSDGRVGNRCTRLPVRRHPVQPDRRSDDRRR